LAIDNKTAQASPLETADMFDLDRFRELFGPEYDSGEMLALAWISYRSFKFDYPSYTDSAEIAFYCGATAMFNAVLRTGDLWASQSYSDPDGTAAKLKEQVKEQWKSFENDVVVEGASEDERKHLKDAFESGGLFVLLSAMCMAEDGDEKFIDRMIALRSELRAFRIKTKSRVTRH
jgi:hypothetical protein